MRTDSAAFTLLNDSPNKDPRYVVEVAFDTANTDLHYYTSHNDTATPTGAVVTKNVIRNIDVVSQQISPRKGNASIGSISFDLLDKNDAVRNLQFTKLALGKSQKNMRARVYVGYEGLAWADYTLVQTQLIQSVTYNNKTYKFKCADVQREARKDLFDLATTTLSAGIDEAQLLIPVYSITNFNLVSHGSSYSDAPNTSVLYLKIENEVVRCTGTTTDGTLGLVFIADQRGALNTKAVAHTVDDTASAERRTKVTEYVYLEMPAVKLALALLTGELYGQAATLSESWHLGIDSAYVKESDFINIKSDLWDPTDDTVGNLVRFEGLKKTDGKKFLEKELMLELGTFMPIGSDGALGLRRMTQILADADYIVQLDETNVVSHGELLHDMKQVQNHLQIAWNVNPQTNKPTRHNILLDAKSIAQHGESKPLKLQFNGLHGSRFSSSQLGTLFDSLRDRFSGPPLTLSITVTPELNTLEVGDVVRVKLDSINDFITGSTIDRSFEVQQVKNNWFTGNINLTLFASSQSSEATAYDTVPAVLNDAYYISQGNDLASYVGGGYNAANHFNLITSVGHITSDCTLTGGSNLNSATNIFYYDGDLQIDDGVTVTLKDNVQLRVKGFLTINGALNGKGEGLAAGGTVGYVGITEAQGGLHYFNSGGFSITRRFTSSRQPIYQSSINSIEVFNLVNGGSSLSGLPNSLLGTSGNSGGNFTTKTAGGGTSIIASGGGGGNGGAGLTTITRGVSFGANGRVITSGNDGAQGSSGQGGGANADFVGYSGSGGGGSAGCWLCLLDGYNANIPQLTNTFIAVRGNNPLVGSRINSPDTRANLGSFQSSYYQGLPGKDVATSRVRVQFIPANAVIEVDPDQGEIIKPTFLTINSGTNELFINSDGGIITRARLSWAATTDPRVVGYETEYKPSSSLVWYPGPTNLGIGSTETYISNLKANTPYDFRVRAADNIRNTSDWVQSLNHLVLGKSEPPEDVAGFSVLQNGEAAVIKWIAVSDTDLAGYDIRYGPQDANDFNNATPLTTITKGTNVTSADIASGDWRFYIKAVDTSGNVSVNAASFDMSFVSSFDIIYQNNEAPEWPGTLTNFIKHYTGVLIPDSTDTDSTADDVMDVFIKNPYADCYYETLEIDSDYDDDVRVWGDIISVLGPTETGVADPTLQIDYRLNAGSYNGYEPWSVGVVTARFIKHRLHLDTTKGVAIIQQFNPTVDLLEWSQRGGNVIVPASGLTINYPKPFHMPPLVKVLMQGGSALFVTRETITESSFLVHVWNTSGAEVGGTIDWEATGV